MTQCVFCEATTDLNTQMTIKLDNGNKVEVSVCDPHSETATPKTVKVAYLEKQGKAEALIAQLKAMGIEVAAVEKRSSGLIVPALPKPVPAHREPTPASPQPEDLDGDDVVDTTLLDAKSKGMVSRGGSINAGGIATNVTSHASHDLHNLRLDQEQRQALAGATKGKAKMTVMEGREGQPLILPEKRVDGLGTTRLKIAKKEDDGRLQNRFKKMAKDSIERDRSPDFARSGYQNAQSTCPICHGECVIRQAGKETGCPKCNGMGFISTY